MSLKFFQLVQKNLSSIPGMNYFSPIIYVDKLWELC